MRWPDMALLGTVLAACTASPDVPPDVARRLQQAPDDAPARLLLEGNQLRAAAVPLGPYEMPAAIRSTIDAIAPSGETTFAGREWGPRGEGYRIEKRYLDGGTEHVRTALIAEDGTVLERAHSVRLDEAPESVLATALQTGPLVTLAMVVSGPNREEYWRCTVRDRIGRTFVVTIELDGGLRSVTRQISARVDV